MPWSRKWQSTPAVFLPGESPWTEEPGRLQSIGLKRVGHDCVCAPPQHTHTCTHAHTHVCAHTHTHTHTPFYSRDFRRTMRRYKLFGSLQSPGQMKAHCAQNIKANSGLSDASLRGRVGIGRVYELSVPHTLAQLLFCDLKA